jgi:hypothetical protein
MPLLEAFPFPSTLGKVTLHQLSQACMFIYSSHRKCVFPPLLWSFPPTTTFTSFPSPGCWACATAPAFSSQLVVRDFPSSAFSAQGAPPSLLHVFFVVNRLLFSFFFFFPGWVSVCPGGYADLAQGCQWEYCVPLSSPCGLHLPKLSGCWHLVAVWEPSWFLCLMWSGDAMCRLGVWRSQNFASSQWFFLQGLSPASLQDFTLGGMLSASSL